MSGTAGRLHGIWPPLLLETLPDGSIDFAAIAAGIGYFAAAGVHGVYTADTASEFYTMEFAEWDSLATQFRALTRASGLLAGIGCTWTNQAGVLARIARARELGYDNIHLSQPYWIKLNEPAQRTYWQAVEAAAQGLPIIVYAGSQGQFPLDGPLLLKLRQHCPSIAGTKSAGFDALATNSLLVHCPDLSHFVHEQVFALWRGVGAAGCFSSLVALCPPLAMHWYALTESGDWPAAFAIQQRVNRFYEDGVIPVRRAGYILDKAAYVLGRVPGATLAQRPPYMPIPDELMRGLDAAARRHLPEFAAALAARGF